jgi:hypothetical protein
MAGAVGSAPAIACGSSRPHAPLRRRTRPAGARSAKRKSLTGASQRLPSLARGGSCGSRPWRQRHGQPRRGSRWSGRAGTWSSCAKKCSSGCASTSRAAVPTAPVWKRRGERCEWRGRCMQTPSRGAAHCAAHPRQARRRSSAGGCTAAWEGTPGASRSRARARRLACSRAGPAGAACCAAVRDGVGIRKPPCGRGWPNGRVHTAAVSTDGVRDGAVVSWGKSLKNWQLEGALEYMASPRIAPEAP